MKELEVYKVSFLDWECAVRSETTFAIFYHRAPTRRGAIRKARKFIQEQP